MFGETPYKSSDVNSYSIGGPQSSSLTLDVVTQTVKICNGILKDKDAQEGTEDSVLKCLKNTLHLLEYINSKKSCSLGIHPYIYFYSDIGKHKVGSYYGFLLFTKELVETRRLNLFTSIRGEFEQVIYKYSFLVQQILRRKRQSKRAYVAIKDYFAELMNIISQNKNISEEEIVNKLRLLPEFTYLQTEIIDTARVSVKGNFSRSKKQQIKLQTYIKSLPKCPICGGYISNTSMSIDHICRKVDGGSNDIKNGQVTHLYCNTTYKN